jgi:hypothetical protein
MMDAADEIERLRVNLRLADAGFTLCQPTLTDEEREAIGEALEGYSENDDDPECSRIAWILSRLLQRTK